MVKFVTPQEMAQIERITPRTVWKRLRAGEYPMQHVKRFNNRYLLDAESIMKGRTGR